MDQNIVQEMLHEIFASLEALDTQTTAIRQFLKDKGIATEPELAPYLEQAGNASGVRWLALRVRIEYLLSSAIKPAEQDAKKDSSRPAENKNGKEANAAADKTGEEELEKEPAKAPEKEPKREREKKDATGTRQADTSSKSEADQAAVAPEKNNNQENEEAHRTNDNATKSAA